MPEIIYDNRLWNLGYAHNCRIDGNSLIASEKALYISSGIDSFENGTNWSRLTLSASENSSYTLSFFASDFKTVYHNGGLINADEIIEDASLDAEQKAAVLEGLWSVMTPNPADIPLFSVKGRYFWFMLEIHEGASVSVSKLKIEFGRQSWTELLPDIYQNGSNSFLNRFLSMLQSVYDDLDREIQNISSILDIDSAQGERLSWLSEWIGAKEFSAWPEERLRMLAANAYALSKIKGTRECLFRAVELYTGERPLIAEGCDAVLYENGSIYGSDIYSVTIIVSEENLADKDASELVRLIEYYAPVHARMRIAVLKPYVVLGLHTYIGINARLSPPEAFELSQKSAVGFGVVK